MVFHVQSLITRVLDPPTYSHQSDANCGKIRYVSDPSWQFRSFKFGNGSKMLEENLVILEFKYLQNKK